MNLCSWNLWNFIQEPRGWIGFRLGTQWLDELSFRNPMVGWTFVQEPGGLTDFRPGTRMFEQASFIKPGDFGI